MSEISIYFLILFAMIAGFGKAMRDTIIHHWHKSIFRNLRNEKLMKWFRSDWLDRPDHPIWFIWDGWHLADTISYLSLMSCLFFIQSWWNIFLILLGFYGAFNVFYKAILIVDS